MRIRLAEAPDIQAAARLWRERVALLQQSDPSLRLLPDAVALWSEAAQKWIGDTNIRFLVGEKRGALVGFAVVGIAPGKPGRQPQSRGVLLEMAVDLHDTHRGLSDQLLAQATRWLRESGVALLEIEAPARCPVEGAFWRARGARPRSECLWLPL